MVQHGTVDLYQVLARASGDGQLGGTTTLRQRAQTITRGGGNAWYFGWAYNGAWPETAVVPIAYGAIHCLRRHPDIPP